MLRLKEAVSLGFVFGSMYFYPYVGVLFSRLKMARKVGSLPNMSVFRICYWCGCLDHADRDCDLWTESNGTLCISNQEYGSLSW